jgi:transposase
MGGFMAKSKAIVKNLGGRPTTYKQEYCQAVIDFMAKGYSFEAFAGSIDTHKDTLYQWCKVHPAFSDAKRLGFAKAQIFWEEIGLRGMWTEEGGPKLNTGNYIFQMKNRFGWQDKVEITGGDNDRPLVLSYKA